MMTERVESAATLYDPLQGGFDGLVISQWYPEHATGGLLVAFLYLLLGLPFARLARSMEEKLGKGNANPMVARPGFGRRRV